MFLIRLYIFAYLAYEEIGAGYAIVDLNTKENNVRHKYILLSYSISCFFETMHSTV